MEVWGGGVLGTLGTYRDDKGIDGSPCEGSCIGVIKRSAHVSSTLNEKHKPSKSQTAAFNGLWSRVVLEICLSLRGPWKFALHLEP